MSRGLFEIITRWKKGNEIEASAARELQELGENAGSPVKLLPTLLHLQAKGMLSTEVVFCLIADLVEETAEKTARESLGEWEEHEETLIDLRCELRAELREAVDSFLERNPLPKGTVAMVLQDMLEEPTWKETAPCYDDIKATKVAEALPDLFRQFGLPEMADLYSQDREQFKRRKEAGERAILGNTYEEDGRIGLPSFRQPVE